jgi:hypothetical protein
MPSRSGDGGAENGEGAQIATAMVVGRSWNFRRAQIGVVFVQHSVRSLDPYKYRSSWIFGLNLKTFFQFWLVYDN